ncbi:MAG: hypothetical protein WCG16_13085 [Methylococcales bacterium]
MDEADKTERVMEIMNQAHLSNSHRFVPSIKAMGYCHFCDAPVAENFRWCDAKCRNNWEKEHAA